MARLGRRPGAVRVEVWLASAVGGIAVIRNLTTAVQILTGRFLYYFGSGDPRLPLVQLPQLLQADVRPGHTYTVADLAPGLRVLCASPSVVAAGTIAVAVVLLGDKRKVALRGRIVPEQESHGIKDCTLPSIVVSRDQRGPPNRETFYRRHRTKSGNRHRL